MELAVWVSGFLIVLSIPCSIFFISDILFPDFKWQDTSVYQCDDDYIVIQNFDGFVTTDVTSLRMVRTKSPFGMIRIVEQMIILPIDENAFDGDKVTLIISIGIKYGYKVAKRFLFSASKK